MQLQVARIGKPHGIRGEVTVQVLTDAPEDRFVPGTEFVVEPASAGPLTLRSARWNKDILLLGFDEVADRNRAETLRGAKLFIETEELDEDDDEGWYEHELVGLEARVGSQAVGKVTALNTMPVQDLLVIESADGKEILIPFVEQIVPEVNVGEGYVLLTPPAGLFEVNEESAEDPETRGSDSAEDSDGDLVGEDAEPEAKA
ncbi:ribosome maturation factor RimM [Arthrobacter globiformis]|uniref:Ribosome maturation factor RimM n=1 Tax=Arthrobacter globiformis TaxID=1665 RepID=A0A328H9U0_ARTGO|nr:ribosome maturation factor RimM [Arthrobacter globiformis]RAM35329.1 ribosome maturation factor RimM [Arthrobacter globiformis]